MREDSQHYFEEHGKGKPLVMLHGDGSNAETFSAQVNPLASRFRLIIPERRGHGRTPDLPGDFTYDIFAKDTIAFMDALGVKNAHLLGHSGGADIALFVAIRRPDLVDKLVVVSGESSNKLAEDRKKWTLSLTTEEFSKRAPSVVESFERVTPNGTKQFPAILEKLKRLWTTDWEIPNDQLASIKALTLVMVADHDFGSIEDAAALFRKIPNAQFCVVPGADHGLMLRRPDVVNIVLTDFLEKSHSDRPQVP
jgi:pimeloyl-ACP methyl ester carboxylesterase